SSSVLVDHDKKIWVGTRDYGLFEFNNGRFEHVADKLLSSVGINITALHEDRQGVLWVGTQGGVARREKGEWKFFTTTDGLAGEFVSSIADDTNGNVWIGTGNGLSQWHDGKFTNFREHEGLPSADISALLTDSSGALWIGTSGRGLARFARGKWLLL